MRLVIDVFDLVETHILEEAGHLEMMQMMIYLWLVRSHNILSVGGLHEWMLFSVYT